jgi:hypothetical protein
LRASVGAAAADERAGLVSAAFSSAPPQAASSRANEAAATGNRHGALESDRGAPAQTRRSRAMKTFMP